MKAFMLIWFGQLISVTGTGMTRFAISLWAWELTGRATPLALVAFFSYAPTIILSPVAGALADRWNRKLVMMISDLAAGLSTVVLLLLSVSARLEIWHIYAAGVFAGAFEAFQFPAYSAAITMMVNKTHYGRTTAMMGLVNSTSRIIAPIAAATLFNFIALDGILRIDIITFVFAVGVLLFVYIPSPPKSSDGIEGQGNLLQESAYGFRYIWRSKPLLGLQLMFFLSNILFAFVLVLMSPYILARTGNDGLQLSIVNGTMGIGAVIGGIILATWGGPKRRIRGIFIGFLIWSFLSAILVGVAHTLMIWVVLALFGGFAQPMIDTSSQAIMQTKIPPDVQGKVFAVSRLVAQIPALLSMLLAGPLADYIFEPSMRPGGMLAPVFGSVIGTGPGAGIGLMFIIVGILEVLIIFGANSIPTIYDLECLLLDHDTPRTEDNLLTGA
jgi:MFS family permease